MIATRSWQARRRLLEHVRRGRAEFYAPPAGCARHRFMSAARACGLVPDASTGRWTPTATTLDLVEQLIVHRKVSRMMAHHTPHVWRKQAPTAPQNSLLEIIQLAEYRTRAPRANAGDGNHHRARSLCLAAAEAHADELKAIQGREGLRAFVESCSMPWDGLWPQIAAAIGVPVDPPDLKAPSTFEKHR